MKRVLVVENGAGFGGALSSLATLLAALPSDAWEVHLVTAYPQEVIWPGFFTGPGAIRVPGKMVPPPSGGVPEARDIAAPAEPAGIEKYGAVRRVLEWPRVRLYGEKARLQVQLTPFFGARAGNAAFLADALSSGRQYAAQVARYVREFDIDLVHANNGVLINDAVVLGARRAKVPCVVHSRAPEYPGRVTAWLARRADAFLAVSGFVAQSVRRLGVEEARVTVVPEGIDRDAFAAGALGNALASPAGNRVDESASSSPSESAEKSLTAAGEFRRSLGIASDVPLVGMVGCLVGWKGHDVFLDACGRVLSEKGAVAVVVGGEPGATRGAAGVAAAPTRTGMAEQPEQGMLDALRNRAETLGIGNRVFFAGHRNDVAAAMAACDIIVHASTLPEPFGRVMLEAMAVGTPVICTRAGGPAEVVRHGENGLLVPPGDAGALADAMARLLEDAALRERLAAAGRETCAAYSLERHVTLVTAVWDRLVGRG